MTKSDSENESMPPGSWWHFYVIKISDFNY